MLRHIPLLALLFASAAALSACGDETTPAEPTPERGTTLYVRAAGMVKALGIT